MLWDSFLFCVRFWDSFELEKLTSYHMMDGLGQDFLEEPNSVPYEVLSLGQLSSVASIQIHSDVSLMLDLLPIRLVHL